MTILFMVSVVFGFVFSDSIFDILAPVLNEMAGQFNNDSSLWIGILSNNVRAAVMIYVLSVFFALMDFIFIIINGVLIGVVGGAFIANNPFKEGIIFLSLILPHGIFEIPALIFASVAGILLFKFILKCAKSAVFEDILNLKELWDFHGNIIKQSFSLLLFSLVLFVVAAIIEGNFTMAFGNWVQSFF